MTVVEFLLERLQSDENYADSVQLNWEEARWVSDRMWRLSYQSPRRIRARVAAKRAIVEAMGDDWVTRILALEYVEHPDYREEWRPE